MTRTARLTKTCAMAIAAFGLSTAAAAQEPKQVIVPEDEAARAIFDQFGFSEAVVHDGTVYLSGVIVGPVPDGKTEAETYDDAFAYIGTILERAGSSWADVIDITTFHTDIDQSLPPFAAAKDMYVESPYPAWTAIGVSRLFDPNGLVEIKIVARVTPEQ